MIRNIFASTALLACAVASPAFAQMDLSKVEITAEELAPGVAALFGEGGNMAVSYGEDGTILIDDQYAPLSDKISIAIKQLGASPVKMLVNTHWHGDHSGGNENFAMAGATIFAHDNVRVRMSNPHTRSTGTILPASPKAALPIVTYDRGVTFHLNGDTIDVIATSGGHTDGDSIVVWREKNIVHMGDLYFNLGGWPFLDMVSGGNAHNMLLSMDTALGLMDENTKVIPGHGPMSNKAEMLANRLMLGEAFDRIAALKKQGMTLEEAQAAKPLTSFNRSEGFVTADMFIAAVWKSID